MSYRNEIKVWVLCLGILLIPITTMATEDKNIKENKAFEYRLEDIKIAKTIGTWEQGKESGYFTVIVYRHGLEHATEVTRVIVKKVNTLTDGTSDVKIIKDITIDTPYISGSVQDMRLSIVNNKLFLGLDILMRGMAGAVLQKSLLIDVNGHIRIIQDVSYDDAIHDEIK